MKISNYIQYRLHIPQILKNVITICGKDNTVKQKCNIPTVTQKWEKKKGRGPCPARTV